MNYPHTYGLCIRRLPMHYTYTVVQISLLRILDVTHEYRQLFDSALDRLSDLSLRALDCSVCVAIIHICTNLLFCVFEYIFSGVLDCKGQTLLECKP